jgi:large subunit ribosomal protein L24
MKNTNKKLNVKTSDRVIVLSGKDKGKTGNVKSVDPAAAKIVVEGVNMVTKAQKPQPAAGIQGGLIKLEAPMNSSKVMVVCPACEKPTRVKHEIKDDKKVRVCKKCGEQLDV